MRARFLTIVTCHRHFLTPLLHPQPLHIEHCAVGTEDIKYTVNQHLCTLYLVTLYILHALRIFLIGSLDRKVGFDRREITAFCGKQIYAIRCT